MRLDGETTTARRSRWAPALGPWAVMAMLAGLAAGSGAHGPVEGKAAVSGSVLRAVDCPRDRIILIAHRGLGPGTRTLDSRRYSEDTVLAFRKAMGVGADGFETDYWPSMDGRIVSHHDHTLERMTNGTGRIGASTWRYISRLRNVSGAPVPTLRGLQDAMERDSGHRQQEIKDGDVFSTALLRRMVAVDRATVRDVTRQVLFTSGQVRTLRRLNSIDPRVRVGLIDRSSNGRPSIRKLPPWVDVVLIDFRAADREYVARAGRTGVQVSVREVNTVWRLHRAVAMGAARAVTDRPDLLGRAC